jgi:hypothetical protein
MQATALRAGAFVGGERPYALEHSPSRPTFSVVNP